MRSVPIALFAILVLLSCEPNVPVSDWQKPIAKYFDQKLAPFLHGVASGDPLQDAVIIWTRVTPREFMASVNVEWEVSTSPGFDSVTAKGMISTDPERDYTVKVDVKGLSPGTQYYYRFKVLETYSSVGKTKTAPEDNKSLRFAVVSCSNYEWGFFNAYKAIAQQNDLDAVIHLGDYIYEYGPGTYGDTTLNRKHMPAREIVTLEDYRTRYSQYRLDPDLRAVHMSHPFINIWDDHEIANDAHKSGAQNHQDEEGNYEDRRSAAVKAFYEWIPIRESDKHYRSFNFGPMAQVFMLDERLEGRTPPVQDVSDPNIRNAGRSMLGAEQLKWLQDGVSSSKARWKVIGNQVIYSYLNWGYEPNFTINMDSWDGYPEEQEVIADFIRTDEIDNIVFVTGDTHSSWAFEVAVDPFTDYDPLTSEGAFAVEFGAPSINSANANENYPEDSVVVHEQRIVNSKINPHLKYADLRRHGFLLMTLDTAFVDAQWHYVSTVVTQEFSSSVGKTVRSETNSNKLNVLE